ncbi:MAG: hypothetical protein M3411_06140 [Chloroflexota bacterium]|nr:hypothetical protein [Chloroflexota bacterium]
MQRAIAAIAGFALSTLMFSGVAVAQETTVPSDSSGGDVIADPAATGVSTVNEDGPSVTYGDVGPDGVLTPVTFTPASNGTGTTSIDPGTVTTDGVVQLPPNSSISNEPGEETAIGNPGDPSPPTASAAPGTINGQAPPPVDTVPSETAPVDTAPVDTAPVAGSPVLGIDPATGYPSCDTWFESQQAYESLGGVNGDPAMVALVDADYDGIACEETMAAENAPVVTAPVETAPVETAPAV